MVLIGAQTGQAQQDKCTKGLSCGLACIDKDKECLKNLSPQARRLYLAMAQTIRDAGGQAGTSQDQSFEQLVNRANITAKRAAAARRRGNIAQAEELEAQLEQEARIVANAMGGKARDLSKRVDITQDDADQLAVLGPGLIAMEEGIREAIEDKQFDTTTPEGFRSFRDHVVNKIRDSAGSGIILDDDTGETVADRVERQFLGQPVNETFRDQVWNAMSPFRRDAWSRNIGSLGKGQERMTDIIIDENGNPVAERRGNKVGPDRGKAMLYQYMRRGGSSIYSENDDLIDLSDAELEHVLGMNAQTGNNTQNKRDSFWNLGWIKSKLNGWKNNMRMDDFIADNASNPDAVTKKLIGQSTSTSNRNNAKQAASLFKNDDNTLFDADGISNTLRSNFTGNPTIDKSVENKFGADVANAWKQSNYQGDAVLQRQVEGHALLHTIGTKAKIKELTRNTGTVNHNVTTSGAAALNADQTPDPTRTDRQKNQYFAGNAYPDWIANYSLGSSGDRQKLQQAWDNATSTWSREIKQGEANNNRIRPDMPKLNQMLYDEIAAIPDLDVPFQTGLW